MTFKVSKALAVVLSLILGTVLYFVIATCLSLMAMGGGFYLPFAFLIFGVFVAYILIFSLLYKFFVQDSTIRDSLIISLAPFFLLFIFLSGFSYVLRIPSELNAQRYEREVQEFRNQVPDIIRVGNPSFKLISQQTGTYETVLVVNVPTTVLKETPSNFLEDSFIFTIEGKGSASLKSVSCSLADRFEEGSLEGFPIRSHQILKPGSYNLVVKFPCGNEGCGWLRYLTGKTLVVSRRESRTSLSKFNSFIIKDIKTEKAN